MKINVFRTACFLLALGVVLGAFAAHALKQQISADKLLIFETGVRYHMIHALALLILSLNASFFKEKLLKFTVRMLLAGIFFFSGSLYFLSTFEVTGLYEIRSILGPITPIGGLCFITGWVVLGFSRKVPLK